LGKGLGWIKIVTAQRPTFIWGQKFETFLRVTPALAPASILGPLTQNGLTKKLVLILHFEFCTLHLFSLPALPINILAPSTYNCNAPRRLCQIKCNYFGSPFWVSGPKMEAGAILRVTRTDFKI
jgi:hypothetical protein